MPNEIVKYEQVKDRIIVLRGEPVLLDADVAQLYGVETKRVNEAVKNNPDKFPEGFLFPLSDKEKSEVVENFDHLRKLKFSPVNPTISRHIKNIFEDGELEEKSVVAFFATTASDGKTYQVAYYNLDVIISVGYRVKSKRGVQFRQWATFE